MRSSVFLPPQPRTKHPVVNDTYKSHWLAEPDADLKLPLTGKRQSEQGHKSSFAQSSCDVSPQGDESTPRGHPIYTTADGSVTQLTSRKPFDKKTLPSSNSDLEIVQFISAGVVPDDMKPKTPNNTYKSRLPHLDTDTSEGSVAEIWSSDQKPTPMLRAPAKQNLKPNFFVESMSAAPVLWSSDFYTSPLKQRNHSEPSKTYALSPGFQFQDNDLSICEIKPNLADDDLCSVTAWEHPASFNFVFTWLWCLHFSLHVLNYQLINLRKYTNANACFIRPISTKCNR